MIKKSLLLLSVATVFLLAAPPASASSVVIASQTDDTAVATSPIFGGLYFGFGYSYALGSGLSGTLDSLTLRLDGKSTTNTWALFFVCRTGPDLISSPTCSGDEGGIDGLRNVDGAVTPPATTVGKADYTAVWAGTHVLDPAKYYFFKLAVTAYDIFAPPSDIFGSTDDSSYASGSCYNAGGQTSDGMCDALPDAYFVLKATPPPPSAVLSVVSIASNNANPAFAKVGDTVTVSFESTVELGAATATIAGQSTPVATSSATTYSTLYQLSAGDSEGPVAFALSYANLSGAAGFTTSTTTNASSVIFDKTAPALSITAGPAEGSLTNSISATFSFTSDAPTVCSIDGGALAVCAGSYSVSGLGSGTHFVTVSATDDAGNTSTATRSWNIDNAAPVLQEVAIATTTSDVTPEYIFSSSKPGMIIYGGACTSTSTTAVQGDNTITFSQLAPGTYSDCTLQVIDVLGNSSQLLHVSTFTITSTAPPSDRPHDKDQCKVNGWRKFLSPSFKNQGDCVSYVNHSEHRDERGDDRDKDDRDD